MLPYPQNAAAVLMLLSLIALPGTIASPPAPEVLLVKLRPASLKSGASAGAVPPGTSLKQQLTEDGVYRVTVEEGASADDALKRLQSWPTVAWAEKDVQVILTARPNDPRFRTQARYMKHVNALQAWDVTQGSKRVTVCTIDSGVDATHPDLQDNIAADSGISVIGLPADQWPAMRGNRTWPDGMPKDVNDVVGHGTMIAGIIGAVGNNGKGVSGVAWKANIVSCKAFTNTQSSLSAMLPCFDYCTKRRARIIVTAWGTTTKSAFLKEAVRRVVRRGALVVAPAGNSADDNDVTPFYPGGYSSIYSGVISVGATNDNGYRAGFSNWGRRTVDLFAPGDGIVSTRASSQGGGYTQASGTSMSVPMVAGAAMLMASAANNRLRGSALKALLRDTVEPSLKLATLCQTGGELNVGRSVYKAKGLCYPPDGNCKP